MKTRMLWPGVFAMLVAALPAAAKTVPMPTLSLNAVQNACRNAGGVVYGAKDPVNGYGCASQLGIVKCSAEAECYGYVSDLRPIPTNSLNAVLGSAVVSGPIRVLPRDPRILPTDTRIKSKDANVAP